MGCPLRATADRPNTNIHNSGKSDIVTHWLNFGHDAPPKIGRERNTLSHREMPSGAVMKPIMTPAAHKVLVNIAHVLKETNAFQLAVRREREEDWR